MNEFLMGLFFGVFIGYYLGIIVFYIFTRKWGDIMACSKGKGGKKK